MAPWCLFDSFMRKFDYIDIVLGHSSLEAINERLSKEKALFDCWNKSWIGGFDNIYGIKVMAKLDDIIY